MRRLIGVLRETDAGEDYFRAWAGNMQSLHGAVFGYIESVIVLAALQLAAFATSSWLVWGLYLVGYGMLIILTSAYFRASLMLLVNRIGLSGRIRQLALWVSGLGALALNTWMVGAVSSVLSELIAAGLT